MFDFLLANSTAIYVAELLVLIALFALWESRRPYVDRSSTDHTNRHIAHCLLLTVNQVVAIATGWFLAWFLAGLVADFPWAVLPQLRASGVTLIIAGFLLLDLTQYLRHRIMHVGWLWRVHQVHHSDQDIDWSTELRFHPIEAVVSVAFRFAAIVLFGIPGEAIVVYALAALSIGFLQHANVRLPAALESLLSKVLVTPALHRVHHADNPECYDRNFAVIFIWWDMLLGSYSRPEDEREFGLPGESVGENRLRDLLARPFRPARTLNTDPGQGTGP